MTHNNQLLLQPSNRLPEGNRVIRCHNLRPTTTAEGMALEPVPLPAGAFGDGWLPFAEVPQVGSNSVVVCSRGATLAIVEGSSVLASFDLDGEPRCAMSAVGSLTVMTDRSTFNLSVTEDYISGSTPSRPTPPRFRTTKHIGLSVNLPAIELSNSYSSATQFSSSDLRAISQNINNAYNEVDSTARTSGVWWQPTVLQTILRDAAGQIVMMSPPTLIVHPDGEQFPTSIKMQTDSSANVLGQTIDIPAWKLAIDIPADAASTYANVATLEVVASPSMHSADTSAQCSATLRRRTDDDYFCVARYAQPTTAASTRMVHEVMAHFDALQHTILTINNPAIYAGQSVVINNPIGSNAKSDNAELLAALRKDISKISLSESRLQVPHTFVARMTAECGGTNIWADLTAFPFAGYGAEHFASSVRNSSWHAAAKVTFSDGFSVVTTSEGLDNAPKAFGPILSYPSADAVAITMTVLADGVVRTGTFPLTADPTGSRALYIAPDLRPFELPLEVEAYVVPDENRPSRRMPDYLACSDAASPLSLTGITNFPAMDVITLVPARFGQSTWDFGRSRFYAMCRSGIHSLSVASDRKSLSLSLIDNRCPASPQAVAEANDAIYAIIGGDIVRISGTKVTTYATSSALALAWNNRRRELWCIPDEGRAIEVICTDLGRQRYTLDFNVDPARTIRVGSTSFLASSAKVYRLGSETSSVNHNVEWGSEVIFPKSLPRKTCIHVDMVGHFNKFSITARHINLGRMTPSDEMRMELTGEVRSPIHRSFWPMRGQRLRTWLSGIVKEDFIFSSVSWT